MMIRVIEGLVSFAATWVAIASGHYLSCDCTDSHHHKIEVRRHG